MRRAAPEKLGTYTSCTVNTAHPDVEQRLVAAVSPYYDVVSLADVRLKGLAAETLTFDLIGSRGIGGSVVKIRFFEFGTEQLVSEVRVKRGKFWSGMNQAMREALQLLDAEAAAFSKRVHAAAADRQP